MQTAQKLYSSANLYCGIEHSSSWNMHKRKSAQSRFHSRLRAFCLGCTLIVLLVFCWTLPAMAQSEITWDDLQSQSTHLQNPYEELTKEQTYRLSSLYQLKEWVKGSQTSADSFEAKEIKRLEQSFIDEGLDTSQLLNQVEDAKAYLQSQSTTTNSELEGRLVQLSGYVLPLQESKPVQTDQWVKDQCKDETRIN